MIAPSAEDLAKVKELAVSLPSSLLKTALLDAVAEFADHDDPMPVVHPLFGDIVDKFYDATTGVFGRQS